MFTRQLANSFMSLLTNSRTAYLCTPAGKPRPHAGGNRVRGEVPFVASCDCGGAFRDESVRKSR